MRDFLMKIFCEGEEPSFSRVATFVVVCFSMGWVTSIVWHQHALPDFGGLALFIGTLYGIKQVGNIATTLGGPKPPQP